MLRPLPSHANSRSRNRLLATGFLIALVALLIFGGSYILSFVSSTAHSIFFPAVKVADAISNKTSEVFNIVFSTRAGLVAENTDLRERLDTLSAEVLDREMLLQENRALREVLGRREEERTVLGSVLSRPNRSPYDTLLIDIGADRGLRAGDYVLGLGSVVIGRVAAVYEESSLVKLLSAPGEEQEVLVGTSTPAKAIGVGGGNFRIILPKGVPVSVGDPIVFPGISPRIFGKVEEIESGSSDTFERIFFQSPINLFELRWVEILSR